MKTLNDVLKNTLTVGDLIDLLKKEDFHMPIGQVGHFGEVLLVDKNYAISKRKGEVTTNGRQWGSESLGEVEILTIDIPDKGEEPD
jgi:hypothetical protein